MCKGRFNTQPPEGGWSSIRANLSDLPTVSTRSRPKAAGAASSAMAAFSKGFNTQPPEGGWMKAVKPPFGLRSFNTQPPEGGWPRF